MKRILVLSIIVISSVSACIEEKKPFNGLNLNMGNLYRVSKAKSRSISPENLTGEVGKGGMATLENGTAAKAASELGQGWKVNPCIFIEPGETFTLAKIEGEGAIQHIWMTPAGNYRKMIFRIYWDHETIPSVEAPVGDFFASGWGSGNEPRIQSLAICVNPASGLNSYWMMPFRKKCKITMENIDSNRVRLFYQIDYTLTDIPDDAAYFHARFNMARPVPIKGEYTIVDKIKGHGQYVGTYLAHGAYRYKWWGEGEFKFYIDGDTKFPTICGTGEEDYFCGSYGYEEIIHENKIATYGTFSSPYTGFYYFTCDSSVSYATAVGQYRWHINDPIRFENELKITVQCLGWKEGGLYKILEDDLFSVAYWYQNEPHHPYPPLPDKEKLVVNIKRQ